MPVNELPFKQIPRWLRSFAERPDDCVRFPLYNILKDSLYYPACGLNGTPVKFLSGNVLSFVYADYSVSKEDFLANLNGQGPDCGFRGYTSIYQREVFRKDIVPRDWYPPVNPHQNIDRLRERQKECHPFGHWSLWKRRAQLDDRHGSELFSFFYLSGEMSALYQGLYTRLKINPFILAIIQRGAMGGEWECVTSDDSFFKKVVVANPGGMPAYLLYGGLSGPDFYEDSCWSEYKGKRIVQLPERYAGLWALNFN